MIFKFLNCKKKLILSLLIFGLIGLVQLSAQTRFKQRLEWSDDSNVLEYKVQVKDSAGKIIKTVTTEDNFLELTLSPGTYSYKIIAYDFLGRESVATDWLYFDILKASTPSIEHAKTLESLSEDGKSLDLAVDIADVSADTTVELVNTETGATISGSLVMEGKALGSSETQHAVAAHFEDVDVGNWKLVVKNASGLSSESENFEVKDILRKEKEERERLAREEAERKEKERIEQKRIAKEKAEREEAERLAREQAEREEAERLAREQAEREEAERLEAERLAKEQAEREEAERKEAEKKAKEEEKLLAKEEQKKKGVDNTKGVEIKVGAGLVMNLLESQILSDKNYDGLTKDALPDELTLNFRLAASYVPNINKPIVPGVEISYVNFAIENRCFFDKKNNPDYWEYLQSIGFSVFDAYLVGKVSLIKYYINIVN